MAIISTLKDDNKDILIEMDKSLKRAKQLENTLCREKDKLNEAEEELKTARKEKTKLEDML